MLTPNQIKAAELLSQGASHQEVADSVGVSRRTILRWLTGTEFKNWQYALISRPRPAEKTPKPQSKVMADSHSPLRPSDLIQPALESVRNILSDPDVRVADRLRAADLVGRWTGLQEGQGAEFRALQVLFGADMLPQRIVDTAAEGIDEFVEKIRNSFRLQSESGEVLPAEVEDDDWDFDDEDDE